MSEYIGLGRDGDVGVITLNDPQRGNAISLELARQLGTAVQTCAADRSIRALLLNSSGKIFCAGGDLAEFQRKREERTVAIEAVATAFHEAQRRLLELDVPVVIAVQGAAAGAGLTLALLGDVVLSSEQATFVPGFTRLGVSADGGSTWVLPRLIGPRRTAQWLMTGRVLTAGEAEVWGLVTEVIAANELADRASEVAQQLSEGPTPAFGSIKRLVRQSLANTFAEQTRCETRAIVHHAGTFNCEEGVRAFVDRRRARFSGHE